MIQKFLLTAALIVSLPTLSNLFSYNYFCRDIAECSGG